MTHIVAVPAVPFLRLPLDTDHRCRRSVNCQESGWCLQVSQMRTSSCTPSVSFSSTSQANCKTRPYVRLAVFAIGRQPSRLDALLAPHVPRVAPVSIGDQVLSWLRSRRHWYQVSGNLGHWTFAAVRHAGPARVPVLR